MKNLGKTWIVVANASEARVYATNGDLQQLNLVREMQHPDARVSSEREIMSDRQGRNQAPQNRHGFSGTPGSWGTGGQKHAADVKTPRKQVEKEVFCREIADWLHIAASRNGFDDLVLVSGPKFLGMLRDTLSNPVQQRLVCSIDKDYTGKDDRALVKTLRGQLEQQGFLQPHPETTPPSGLNEGQPARPQKGNQQPPG